MDNVGSNSTIGVPAFILLAACCSIGPGLWINPLNLKYHEREKCNMGRVLALALDGFEYTVAEELAKAGRMPALAKIAARSAKFLLDHGSASRTGLAGEHVSIVMTPEMAKRWSAISFDPHSYRIVQQGT